MEFTGRHDVVEQRSGIASHGIAYDDAATMSRHTFVEYDDEESAAWLAAGIEAAYLGAPPTRRDRVPINATVPAVPASEVAGMLARFPGARTAKVKVAEPGQTLDDDVARVAATRELIGRVRVDANGKWDVAQAITALRATCARTRPGPSICWRKASTCWWKNPGCCIQPKPCN